MDRVLHGGLNLCGTHVQVWQVQGHTIAQLACAWPGMHASPKPHGRILAHTCSALRYTRVSTQGYRPSFWVCALQEAPKYREARKNNAGASLVVDATNTNRVGFRVSKILSYLSAKMHRLTSSTAPGVSLQPVLQALPDCKSSKGALCVHPVGSWGKEAEAGCGACGPAGGVCRELGQAGRLLGSPPCSQLCQGGRDRGPIPLGHAFRAVLSQCPWDPGH